jgi:DNA-binding IclR family transcriptional regulator
MTVNRMANGRSARVWGSMARSRADDSGESAAAAEVNPVKSAQRTVRILETLAESPTRLTLTELHERMGYPRSSLHALIRTLREMKWVEADPSGSAFGVGPYALLSGTAYLDRDAALPFAYETLEDLRAELGYTTHYARRIDSDVLYLASREARNGVVPRVGRRLPAHVTALGQVLLAGLTDDEVLAVLPPTLQARTPATITDHKELLEELEDVRGRGWAHESEQGTEGVACVAVVVDYRIPATDAISCSMPAKKANFEEVRRVAAALEEHTANLSATLRREGIR